MVGFAMFGALGLFLPIACAQNCTPLTPSAQIKIADGYTAQVIMNGLKYPRGLLFDTAGNLLIDGDTCVAPSKQLIPDASLNHGIALCQDGKTIFVSSMAEVHAYSYDAEAGTVGTKKILIQGMRSGGHTTRTLLVPTGAPDVLIVSQGSDGNIDNATTDITAERSTIKIFDISEVLASENATDYASDGEVLGWGLRNFVGVGEDPSTGGIWSVENSAEEIHRSNVDLHNDNSAEEMNYHGYPAWFSAWGTVDIPSNAGIIIGSQFGGMAGTSFKQVTSGSPVEEVDEFCRTERQGLRLVFPAHTAPPDIKLEEDGSAAYIAFHGSWDRSPPDGFRLGKVKFADGQPVANVSDTAAVEYVLENQDTTKCPGACFRPTGLVFDKKGRLFMTRDQSGELFVLAI
ncbi:soluble quino protein glucose dehydrogenase [Annulohypoxylon truncatum]|uniref:soluble quino protein glucose dehydrogenase n=1 Tax=Annulohypoxylon truncatum TaxID=327061 RepID=UPI0020086580|nr:soluble quino protein glucose dehydrogenase [Annulohypoxylon truncatum]KAI1204343.1 soluble quino protein glucose dehydrogenase [Annulohypoxylon truncatum]